MPTTTTTTATTTTTMENADNPHDHSTQTQHSRDPLKAGNKTSRHSLQGKLFPGDRKVGQVPGPAWSKRIPQTGKDTGMRRTDMPARPHASGQTYTAPTRSGELDNRSLGQMTRPSPPSPPPSDSRPQPQPPSPVAISSFSGSNMNSRHIWSLFIAKQRRERIHGLGQGSGNPPEGRMNEPSRTTKAETSSLPSSDNAELDVINSYLPPPNDQEAQAKSRPASLGSQLGYALASEDDCWVEEEPGCGDDGWDLCEVSSSDD